MFRGRYEHTIDQKGRLSIPSRFREVISTRHDERLIVTNYDGALWAYPFPEWMEVEKAVSALPQSKTEVKYFQRVFIAGATECPLDRHGRILLPPSLREYAGLDREVVLVGVIKRIEIWAKDRWESEFTKAQDALGGLGEQLAGLGL